MLYLGQGHPARAAVTDAEGTWTYDELADHVERVAGSFGALERRCVAITPRRTRDSVALLLGIFEAGGIAVPFSTRAVAREIAHQVTDADISLVIADPPSEETLREALALGVSPTKVIAPRDLLRGKGSKHFRGPTLEDPALIIYTSGTTGLPKGVVHTHASLTAQVDVLCKAWEWSLDDRLLHVLPLHHIHGLVNGLLGALWAGAEIRFLETFAPFDLWRTLVARTATVLYAVPTIYHQLADTWDAQEAEAKRQWATGAAGLRLAVSGSSALPARLWTRWRDLSGQALLERYGMTEIGMALSNPYRGDRRPGTVGQALPGMEVRIVTEGGKDAPAGTPGEILVRGKSLFTEYWKKPDATRSSFRDGYFLTGDIAEVHDGYVAIRGRSSVDIIKSAGYKISALEIEAVLLEHPAVQDAAVLGIPDQEWGEIVTACLVAKARESVTLGMLREWCCDKLAPYKVPRRISLMDSLPRNAMGKVSKHDLLRALERQ